MVSNTTQSQISSDLVTENAPLHLSIADSLADEIVNNKWEPKTNRKLEDIQKQYGISRTVAREATRLLASLGCVQFQRGTGVIACNPENWDDLNTRVITWKLHSPYRENELRALTELRLVVEPAAAAGCALRGDVEIRYKLGVIGHDMVKAVEENRLAEFHELDIQFHTLLLANSGNPIFAKLSSIVESVLRGRVELNLYPQKPNKEAILNHKKVTQAIMEGDAAAASAAMHDIVAEVNTALGLAAL